MDLRKAFATDTEAEIKGVPFEYGDSTFIIARKFNPTHRKLFSKLWKANRLVVEGKGAAAEGDAAEKKADEIMCEVMSKTILLGWKNVQVDGKDLPYSQQAAYDLLLEMKDFREVIDTASAELERFKVHQDKEDEKN